jgi:Protein of unknown function (DUF2721)
METNVNHFLNAQHCLTIAAAFIAIIAACATLINSANSKADSLAGRIREATKEFRERSGNRLRCIQLQEQIELFQQRYRSVQKAQRLLFFTIATFIVSLATFIGLGLYIIYFKIADETLHAIARNPVRVIGVFVAAGTVCMLIAIYFQYWELGKSYNTLSIEIRDCHTINDIDSLTLQNPGSSTVDGNTPEMTTSPG